MAEVPIVVVGSGVAGIASALHLSRSGHKVLLLEKKNVLGGRATSFIDRTTGDEIDNGQHVLLGCCTNMIDLLEQLGQDRRVRWSDAFTYAEPDGTRHVLSPSFLPAPLHFSTSLLSFGALSFSERLEVARAFAAMMLMSRSGLERWRNRPISDWLKARGQSERTIARFWRPIIVGAVNEELDVAASWPSLQVFLEGFLPHRHAARLGVAEVGLEKLYAEPARKQLETSGSEVRTGCRVTGLMVEAGRLRGVHLHGGEMIATDRCILAIPPEALVNIDTGDTPMTAPGLLEKFRHAPIAGLHFWFDRPVLDLEHAALLDTKLEWLFKKSEPGPAAQKLGARERIQGIISAAHHLHGRSQQDILDEALEEMRAAFPGFRDASLVHGMVVRENRATLSLDPIADADRPGQHTPIDGCYLAGDWVKTGWPGTMEGAARSGRRAAALALGSDPEAAVTSDLPRGLVASLLMARSPAPMVRIGR